MDAISTLIGSIFSSPAAIAGVLCGIALLYLVVSRTLKKRGE